jgi:hypothetical protein
VAHLWFYSLALQLEAAPPFAIFEGWAPAAMISGTVPLMFDTFLTRYSAPIAATAPFPQPSTIRIPILVTNSLY